MLPLLLSALFALIPYLPALFVWLTMQWYAFYCVLTHEMGQGVLLWRCVRRLSGGNSRRLSCRWLTTDRCLVFRMRRSALAVHR